MLHIHRQITSLRGFDVHVITQKLEDAGRFPIAAPSVIPRSPLRFAGRLLERHVTGRPWQISQAEVTAIRTALEECGADVLHIFFGNVAVHLLPLLRAVELPIVVSFHGADVTGAIASKKFRAAREEVFERATAIAARSEELAQRVAALGASPGKMQVLRTVIPVLPKEASRASGAGEFVIVQACRLIPKKGVATSLRAFALLLERVPEAVFLIAGTGPEEEPLRDLAASLGIASRVRFFGFLDQAALRALFLSAHVFVHPSATINGDVEGIPNAMLEAMAMGLPVVATRHGGIPEAVSDGVSGILCDEGDAAAVAGALIKLQADPSFAAQLGTNAEVTVREKFSEAAVARDLETFYASLIPPA